MPASPVKIGPFVGGLNTYSSPSAIADNEAVEIQNFDVDLDGSLITRPPISRITAAMPADATGKTSRVIGSYRSVADVFYVIFSFGTHAYAFNTSTEAWTLIQAGDYTATVQYADKLYMILRPSGVTQGGGKWDPTAGYTAVAAIPRGYSACVYKERMFVAASRVADQTSINRVKFSNAANFDVWTGTDYFDVSGGDGQDIMRLYSFDSSICIFKTDSTFIYAYDSAPSKGIVQIVSANIGCNNPFSLVEYENNLFVMHEANVYRISNWTWEQANLKVPFPYANSKAQTSYAGSCLSIIGNRLLVRYYDNYFILGLKTGAWVKWIWNDGSTYYPTDFISNPNVDPVTGVARLYAGNYNTALACWFKFIDSAVSGIGTETFLSKLTTKSYDFGPSYAFKRLYFWGVDIVTTTPVNYTVSPVVYNVPVKWGQLIGVPFSALLTWGRPLSLSIDVTDSASGSSASGYRTFVKLLKSLRFRQVQFTLNTSINTTVLSAPCRVFSLTAFVDSKQVVVKKVS